MSRRKQQGGTRQTADASPYSIPTVFVSTGSDAMAAVFAAIAVAAACASAPIAASAAGAAVRSVALPRH